MIYRLKASMTDRMNFDSVCFAAGYEAGGEQCYRDKTYTDGELYELVQLHFEAAVNAEQIGQIDSAETTEEADLYELDIYPASVDDLQEARARWIFAWQNGFWARQRQD